MAGNPVNQWATGVLQGLGIQPSRGALQALEGWARAEGGHTHNGARYNFLNTTQPMPGAGNTGTQGDIKVYKSLGQGVQATVKTLQNGRYDGIIAGLRAGNPTQVARAIGQSPWAPSASGYGALVAQTIAETSPGKAAPSVSAAAPSLVTPATQTTTTPGVDNSALRRQLVSQFLQQGGVKSSTASLAFASGLQGAQDTPASTQTTTTPGQPQAPGGSGLNVGKITARANRVDANNLPYQWGGGHAGLTRPKNAVPVDCSGAVSEVLGINPKVASQFETWGKPGVGGDVTIYAKSTHVLMAIRGPDGKMHLFGTHSSSTNPDGGAEWIPSNEISPGYLKGFVARHM
jgi:hypothetical protein